MVQENPAARVHAVFTTLSVSFDGLENSARIKVQCVTWIGAWKASFYSV